MSKLVKIEDALRATQESGLRSRAKLRRNATANKYMQIVDSEPSMKNPHDKFVTATLLDNFRQIVDSEIGNSAGATHAQDFAPYVMEVWPLVTAWYPDFPLKDLISVQAMEKPLAWMYFSMLKTGTGKSPQGFGDVVETALGPRVLKGQYPTGEVYGEKILDTQITSDGTLLAYAPLNTSTTPGYDKKIAVTIAGNTYKVSKIEGDNVIFTDGTNDIAKSNLSLSVQTGQLNGTLVTSLAGTAGTTAITANYVWNVDYADTENIQKVKEQVEMRPMEAVPRALSLEWTLFSEYLKKSQFGVDIREDNIKRIMNLMYQYQVNYILTDMYENRDIVAHPDETISIDTSTSISLEVISQRVQKQLKDVGMKILQASGRLEGNKLVVGANLKSWLESLPSNFFNPAITEDAFLLSPRVIGTYGTYQVFYDPQLADNAWWMTYRGNEFYDAAYYLGEYMPIVPTDAIALGVTVRSSFVSMEAYRYDKPNCVIGGKVEMN